MWVSGWSVSTLCNRRRRHHSERCCRHRGRAHLVLVCFLLATRHNYTSINDHSRTELSWCHSLLCTIYLECRCKVVKVKRRKWWVYKTKPKRVRFKTRWRRWWSMPMTLLLRSKLRPNVDHSDKIQMSLFSVDFEFKIERTKEWYKKLKKKRGKNQARRKSRNNDKSCAEQWENLSPK